MNTDLIKMFNAAVEEHDCDLSFKEVNEKAIQLGYIIHPSVCNKSVMSFLDEQTINYNSTFYKTWTDVTSKSRLELFFDQILHYATTYGTEFSMGNGYVPNDNNIELPALTNYKVITVITPEELYDKCYDMVCSGIALKECTVNVLCNYILDFFYKNPSTCIIDINSIKNREALLILSDSLGLYPSNPINLLKLIIYKTTGKTMIIQNSELYNAIKYSDSVFDFTKLTAEQIIGLSSIFLRYKNVFCAFKHCQDLNNNKKAEINAIINKLRRFAVKNHKPQAPGFWQTVFSEEKNVKDLKAEVEKLTNYKKVALMQACLDRATVLNNQFYLVRNQKAYLRMDYKPINRTEYLALVYSILRVSLVESLKKNAYIEETSEDGQTIARAKVIKINKDVKIALPSSEKSFIGNYPFGTTYPLSKNNYIGIYWRNEWGTRDYDLSLINYEGKKIGWNSYYYDVNVVYSGDMTNASPEASEVLYIKDNSNLKALIKVNQFSGDPVSKYKFYFGQDNIEKLSLNYMVNPNSIKLETEVPVNYQKEQNIGLVHNGQIVLMAINTGNKRVSSNKYGAALMDVIEHKSKCFIMADDILSDAGYKIISDDSEKADIDFNQMEKDTLISLMK